jgi:ATP-dependent DNA helicase RecG
MNPNELLNKLESHIKNETYENFETDRFELKDNSHNSSEWTQVYKTANAFLNSKGGVIFIGIFEDKKNNKYVFTGFDFNNENKIKDIWREFTDDKGNKLKDLDVYFPEYEIRNFLNGQTLLIYVDSLPDDEKYVYYKGEAYERLITGDHKISQKKIEAHEEYKKQIRDARELMPVINTTIDDLDVDKLNQYIFLLNRIKKTETQKANIHEARSFLNRKMMIRDDQPTILGMLTCGKNPEDFLFNKCQIDCYVDQPSKELIAKSRKLLIDTVINLMEEAERFIVQNIETGISAIKGGSPTYEYPLELIRESINNSLAHRDYSIDRFVTVKVVPKTQIEIRNPGRFKPQLLIEKAHNNQLIRRIIPGDPQANNPRLANVLKVFNKWEGQGIGMATLTGACLNNEIDLPYYIFHSKDELSLIIPSGKLVDKQMETLFETYTDYIARKLKTQTLSDELKNVISYFYKSERANNLSRYTILLTKDNNHLEAVRLLQVAELIYIVDETDTINPVYFLDPKLFKLNFNTELSDLFGEEFNTLKEDYKNVLNLIYEANQFSQNKYLSANKIGNLLWNRKSNEDVIEGFESFKRKIRKIVRKLDKAHFVKRNLDKPEYLINEDYQNNSSLFLKQD